MSVRQKCKDVNQSDLLNNLPVFDKDTHITYRNIFCARCNGAVNTTYWMLQFDCRKWFNSTAFNLSDSMDVLHTNCTVTKSPALFQWKYLERCIPRFDDCFKVSQEKNQSYCQKECLRYAFPFCERAEGRIRRFRNPQCALCNSLKPYDLDDECMVGNGPVAPPLTILFDFSSTSKYSIFVDDKKLNLQQNIKQVWSCALHEVYDPYTGKCKTIVPAGSQNGYKQNKLIMSEGNTRNETELSQNCLFISFNQSDYKQLPNGSVHIKLHNKTYSNTSYTIRNDKLLLCVSFSRNATTTARKQSFSSKTKTTPASLQILTSVGCIVSMVSLVLLLITYILFAELRNLPGKIVINLALSLLVYQAMFFSAVKTPNHEQCLVIAVLLHFFVLSSFTWMNVMAYDVHRTFTTSGKFSSPVAPSRFLTWDVKLP